MSANNVLAADRFQSTSEDLRAKHGIAPAKRCPRHGEKLWPEKSGSALACVVTRPVPCEHLEMIDLAECATADI